jgi:tetratricopeptide (TPR) repeat protein
MSVSVHVATHRCIVSRTAALIVFCVVACNTGSTQTLATVEPTISVQQLRAPTKAIVELDRSARAFLKGDRIAARNHVERALQIYPSFANALAWRGILNAEDKRLQESCADLERAVATDPNLGLAYAALARTYNNMMRWKDAQRVLEAGLRRNPNVWQAEYEAARAEAGQERFHSALKHLARAEQLNPSNDRELDALKAHILRNMQHGLPLE